MAEWSNLWGHTHDECLALLTDGKAYFTILVSQVTQRLVKAIKQVDFDKMTFLVNFIDEMGKDTNMAKLDGDYTSEAYHCIKTILDPNAVPSRVNTACEAFGKGHELRNHWLITAFSLEKGKEVVDLALQRAKKGKSNQVSLRRLLKRMQTWRRWAFLITIMGSSGKSCRRPFLQTMHRFWLTPIKSVVTQACR